MSFHFGKLEDATEPHTHTHTRIVVYRLTETAEPTACRNINSRYLRWTNEIYEKSKFER